MQLLMYKKCAKKSAFGTPKMASPTRFERATCGLGNRCSIQLSYGDVRGRGKA